MRALAAISGVKFESTVHAWLKQAEPKRDALKKIAEAARISLDWLVSGEPDARLRFYDLRESQGFNEMFLEPGEASKLESTPRWMTFSLEWISGASELGKQYVERWRRNPITAARELFAVRMAGSDGAMRPLINDGDIVIVMRAGVPLNFGRIVTAPFLLSREGKVIARLVGFDVKLGHKARTLIGLPDPSRPAGVLRIAEAEQILGPSPDFVWPQVRILGRIIWCGRSLLDLAED